MSTPLSTAIYSRLSGAEDLSAYPDAVAARTALHALLAADEGGEAIIQGNVDRAVTYPCITFRPSGGVNSLEGHDFGRRVDSHYDFEYWENLGLFPTISDIDGYVEKLLDERFKIAPSLTLSAGRCYWMEALTECAILHNPQINAWFGLRRFRFVEARVA